jgi:DNA-binding Lrp family transcriptional regulator
MQKSHVLISCEKDAEDMIKTKIAKMKEVKKIERTTGHYDLVVELESDNEEKIRKIIGSGIKNMKLVRSTLMLIHA